MKHQISKTSSHTRVSIYLSDPSLKARIKIAAARKGVSLSAYCEEAILHMLGEEITSYTNTYTPKEAAAELDRLREKIGPIGIPVSELINEGCRR
jgi:hypothetical protein